MVTSGRMIEIVADALILPTATVTSYHRQLQQERLVTIGGRGRSAAQTTPADVAKLLITMMGSEKLEEARDICELISTTVSLIGTKPDSKEIRLRTTITLVEAIVILLVQLKPRANRKKQLPLLPFLGDVSGDGVVLDVYPSTLEAHITAGLGSLGFHSLEKPYPEIDPNEWFSLPVRERLLAKAQVGGMLTMRSIDRTALIRLTAALPDDS